MPHNLDANCIDQPLTGRSQCLQQIPFSCDSFDAAIAAHISRQKDKMRCEPTMVSHVSSIWDAEETCDAFVFQKNLAFRQEATSSSGVARPGDGKQMASTSSSGCDRMVEVSFHNIFFFGGHQFIIFFVCQVIIVAGK